MSFEEAVKFTTQSVKDKIEHDVKQRSQELKLMCFNSALVCTEKNPSDVLEVAKKLYEWINE